MIKKIAYSDPHDITEILFKVALNTIKQTHSLYHSDKGHHRTTKKEDQRRRICYLFGERIKTSVAHLNSVEMGQEHTK
jgi:hypothetical protein